MGPWTKTSYGHWQNGQANKSGVSLLWFKSFSGSPPLLSKKSVFQDGRQGFLRSDPSLRPRVSTPVTLLRGSLGSLKTKRIVLPGQPCCFTAVCFDHADLAPWIFRAMISSSSFKNLYANYILPSPGWPLWPTEIIRHLVLHRCYSHKDTLSYYFHIYPSYWMLELVRNKHHLSFIIVCLEAKKPSMKAVRD